jgi:hypothetical protein
VLPVWRADAWTVFCAPDFFARVSSRSELDAWRLVVSRLLLEEPAFVKQLLQPLAVAAATASVFSIFQVCAREEANITNSHVKIS